MTTVATTTTPQAPSALPSPSSSAPQSFANMMASASLAAIIERREEMMSEVHADLKALHEYLTKSVFAAAGFAGFCEQELGRLRDKFLELQSTWRGVAENEWLQGNPRILTTMPPDLRDKGFDTEVCDRVRQLGIAVREAWRSTATEQSLL